MVASASAASGPRTRKCRVDPLAALTRITLTGLLASAHGPAGSSANSMRELNRLATWVSLTDGRAWSPTALVSRADPSSVGPVVASSGDIGRDRCLRWETA